MSKLIASKVLPKLLIIQLILVSGLYFVNSTPTYAQSTPLPTTEVIPEAGKPRSPRLDSVLDSLNVAWENAQSTGHILNIAAAAEEYSVTVESQRVLVTIVMFDVQSADNLI